MDSKPKQSMTNERRIELFRKAKFVILLLLILSALLQIAGFCTPGWVVQSTEVVGMERKLERGLWYFVYCVESDCDTKSYRDLDNYVYTPLKDDDFIEYQVEATFAVIAIILALVVYVVSYNVKSHDFGHMLCVLMAVAALVSGVLSLLAVGRLGDLIRETDEMLGDNSPMEFPYSLLLTAVGGALACIIFFIYIFALICCKPSDGPRYVKKHVPYKVPVRHQNVYVEKPRTPVYVEKPRPPPVQQYVQPERQMEIVAREPFHVKMEIAPNNQPQYVTTDSRYSSAGSRYSSAGSVQYSYAGSAGHPTYAGSTAYPAYAGSTAYPAY